MSENLTETSVNNQMKVEVENKEKESEEPKIE